MAYAAGKKRAKGASTPHVPWEGIPTHSTNGRGVLPKEGERRKGGRDTYTYTT